MPAPSTPKSRALKAATETQARLVRAQAAYRLAAEKRDEAILAAQRHSATYADIQAATGLSVPRITQVLRRARIAHPTK